MTLEVGLIAAALAIILLAVFCTSLAVRIFHLPTMAWLGTMPPAIRANFLLAWAVAPLVIGLIILLLIFSPSLAYLLGVGMDHCPEHGHHAHLCLIHTPLFSGGVLERSILVGTGMFILGYILKTGNQLRKSHQALSTLLALVKPATAHAPYRIVDSPRPFAITAGFVRPQVLLSSGLLDDLTPTELAMVVDHEQAHQRRRDGMRLFATEVLSVLHLPSTRRLILRHLSLATEQVCDETAAAQSGDRLQVAEAIIKMSRLIGSFNPVPGAICVSSAESEVVMRVESLLCPMRTTVSAPRAGFYLLAGLMIAAGLVTGDWWHHSAESLLSSFLG